jgi:hypothetical protein
LEFQDNNKHLVKKGLVNVTMRKDMDVVLKGLRELAAGATGVLTNNDSGYTMKVETHYMVEKLSKCKENHKLTTKDLVKLGQQVLKIWQ